MFRSRERVPAAGSPSAYILDTHRYTVHRDNNDIQSGQCRRIAKRCLAGIIFGHQNFTYVRFRPRIRATDLCCAMNRIRNRNRF
jgi:hypothetical protein